jgi:polygalacturonase
MQNVLLSGLTHKDSQKNHISISGCDNVTVSNLHISAPDDSPNTGGINIGSSNNVQVLDSYIGTGIFHSHLLLLSI